MSLRFRIIFASACALLAVLLCVTYADGVRSDAERMRTEALERFGGEVASLVVATQQLEPGEVVSRSNVVTRDWIADLAPEEAITNLDEVLGREVSEPVAKGSPLTELNFRATDEMGDIPSGRVALSIPITDKLGISRSVVKGTTLVAYEVTASGTQLISGDMTVLSEATAGGLTAATAQVSVAVLPADVSAVLAAAATGDLRLVAPAYDVDLANVVGVAAPAEIALEQPDEQEGENAA